MAIKTARVQINGQWYALTLNQTTRMWEATLTAPPSSIHQPGGYYNLTVEATNETGQTVTADGSTIPGLRLKVQERVRPEITLVSPLRKYREDALPIVFDVTDDDSGANMSTFKLTVDGAPVSAGYSPITDGYRVTYTPPAGYSAIHAEVTDYDGNTGTYDGVFPALKISNDHLIVDTAEISIEGETTGAVRVWRNGELVGTQDADGEYSITIPLVVGDNSVTVGATNQYGLETVQDVFLIRLVTDRTQADVDRLEALLKGGWDRMSAADRAWYMDTVCRGAYNAEDFNRVNRAMAYLQKRYNQRGYSPGYVSQGITWTVDDIPQPAQTQAYLSNVNAFRTISAPYNPPPTPADMDGFTFGEANTIETILVISDAYLKSIGVVQWYAGEIMAGEY